LSFRPPPLSLRDIADAISLIEEFTLGMDFETFREDPKTIAAVERKLLVVSEAAIRMGEQAVLLCTDQPWPKIRATGNFLRHAYERVDLETVWRTVTDDLPRLKAAVLRALAILEGAPTTSPRAT